MDRIRNLPACRLFRTLAAAVCGLVATGLAETAVSQPQRLSGKLGQESPGRLAADAVRFGDPVRGALAFFRPEMNCGKCHEAGGNGRRLGPDLAERREIATEKLVEAILHPSAEIRQGYENTLLVLDDGRQISGIVVAEDDVHLKLDRIEEPTQPLTIDKSSIEDRRPASLSAMPADLANQLGDRGEFLDLVSYLRVIAAEGPTRAAQLRPVNSSAALAPLPEYEARVDHRGMIESWNSGMLEEGESIYRLRCASCHGDLTGEGTMPTSLRFPSGKFRRGSDPYAIYQTLTHGYGMMNAQRWMVPEQKYAVIHYLRETFLRDANPDQYFPVDSEWLATLPPGDTRGPKPVESRPWTLMDYGPSLLNTFEVSREPRNIAQKGIAVRLDDGPGGVGAGSHWLMYDHDTLRVAGAWSGEFTDYNGIHFNGVHGQHPRIAGTLHLQNPEGPGWGSPADGSFADTRLVGRDSRRYGPLERNWAQYRGFFRFGRQTILQYTVGNTEILETPGLQYLAGRPAFIRTLSVGPRDRDLLVQLAQEPGGFVPNGNWMVHLRGEDRPAAEPTPSFDGRTFYQAPADKNLNTHDRDFSVVARIRTENDGTIWSRTADQAEWVPDGQSLFVRDGRLTLDFGWVGAVQSSRTVADGEWHDLVMTWNAEDSRVSFFVDGQAAGGGVLKTRAPLPDAVIRIGGTNDNFPDPGLFQGEIAEVRIFQSVLDEEQIRNPEGLRKADCHAGWSGFSRDTAADITGRGSDAVRVGGPAKERSPIGLMVSAATESGPVLPGQWVVERTGDLRLRLPAGPEPLRLTLCMASLAAAGEVSAVAGAAVDQLGPPVDLAPLIQGGPSNWPDELETELQVGPDSGPYVVDTLVHPAENPGNCRLRMTGLDFVPGGDAMVVATWDGSVWMVRGIRGTAAGSVLKWRRIAAGLFQPLGIRIRDGIVHVACRDQLVALHDLNGDGETDWYRCFNNDHQVTEHFHEFAMGLQTDAAGNFYYAKSARHGLPAVVPHHGTLLKVSADGGSTEILATGFRAANGVCLNPDGSFVVTDQEGFWNPKNRINWVDAGGFYGNMLGYHDVTDPSDSAMKPPLCWITNAMDRSPAELLWAESDRWGPLSGSLLNFSYGYGRIFLVPHERVGEVMQGGVCQLDLPQFPTGIMRGRFSPVDGQLYCCGMFAWSGTQEQPGGLYRVRYTGGPAWMPVGLHAVAEGLEIRFSGPLARASAEDAAGYSVSVWDLKRTAAYGSEHCNERRLEVGSAELLPDGQTVRLRIPGISPTWCMEVVYSLESADGRPVRGKIHNTIHVLGDSAEEK